MNIWSNPGDRDGKLGPWNTIKLDGLIFPGVSNYDDPGACPVTVRGASSFRIDRQKKKGGDGHRLVVEGYQPANVELRVRIWRQEQLNAYRAYLPLINPKFLKISTKQDSKITKKTKLTTVVQDANVSLISSVGDIVPSFGPPQIKTTTTTTTSLSNSLKATLGGHAQRTGDVANPFAAAGLGAAEEVATNRTVHLLEHPDLEMLDITRVYIIEVPTLDDGEVVSERIVTIKCIEIFGDEESQKTKQSAQVVKGKDLNSANGRPVAEGLSFNTGPRR